MAQHKGEKGVVTGRSNRRGEYAASFKESQVSAQRRGVYPVQSGEPGKLPELVWPQGFVALLVLIGSYLLVGLIGHDPWKQDETYIFGAIQHLLETGDLVVPMVAGEPFMEKPPLFYWTAAGFARLLAPWLSLHDGARLATGAFMAITCMAVGISARQIWGKGTGRFAVLTLLSSPAMIWYAHLMLTDIALVTGFAMATAGLILLPQQHCRGSLLLGTGAGIGFLAKGLIAPGVLGATVVILPILFRNWRTTAYFRALLYRALPAALPWLLIWPVALYLRSPALFADWFWQNNIGRFFGFSVAELGAPHDPFFWMQTLPLVTFPALPLAAVTLWRQRARLREQAALQVSVVLATVFMAVLAVSASARANYGLPLLVPICLLAAPAVSALPNQINRIWDWSARVLFCALAVLIWTVWTIMAMSGSSPSWSFIIRYLPVDYAISTSLPHIGLAVGASALAVMTMMRLGHIASRGLVCWLTGMTWCLVLICTLLLPWIDYAKSYRSVFLSMQAALPSQPICVSSTGLGESERAMLRYFLGVNTWRTEIASNAQCAAYLIEGLANAPPDAHRVAGWRLVWNGARPGDQRERFWLYARS